MRAPGRVNLIGEHTDHAEGFVLPCAIDRDLRIWAAPRDDRRLRALALDLGEEAEVDLESPARRYDWSDYLVGVAVALAERGHPVVGLDLAVASRVPPGAGVSSSAALGVAAAAAFDRAGGLGLGPRGWAELAHRSENHFVGVACGILDPFASALCREGEALWIDCRTRESEPVPLPAGRLALLLTHSGVTRALVDGRYGERVADCRAAVEALASAGLLDPPARTLRDVAAGRLDEACALLDPRPARRTRHVVGENARVGAFRRALEAGDLEAAGACIRASHRSLRDDFEVSVPEIDFLCERADAHPAVYGSRLLGGGFGGCALHLVDPGGAEDARAWIDRGFAERTGSAPEGWQVEPGPGASVSDPLG